MTDSTLTPPAADMMSFLSTTPEHKDSEYETPVMDCSGEVVRTVNRPLAWR
ncbi:hypothetical protein O2Z10_004480 [Salmonella enterica]|nr:hypothetical protein [Salmonella enterica]EKG2925617.1 hypothetical protein [Salmonella enterica]